MSEAEARRQAAIFGQQPYRCDLCERWHCGTVRP
jgi:hypothetical protein